MVPGLRLAAPVATLHAAMAEHLTQEQYDQLAAEVAELEGPRRAEIVEAIAVARGHGDLSERTSSTTRRRTSRGYWSARSRSCAPGS